MYQLFAAGLLLLLATSAVAAEDAVLTEERPIEITNEAALGVGPMNGRFSFWTSDDGQAFIKPALMVSSTLVHYRPTNADNPDLSNRTSTLINARFGIEGRVNDWISFKSQFERNVGYALGRNGPVGTSIWEGTASLQARENYIRLDRWNATLAGGIVADPASIDFVSEHVLDMFGMDPYIRDPLLITGFNQGQGLISQYAYELPSDLGRLTAGFAFIGGNPLTTSLSFGFGGNVSPNGTLFTAPLRALSNGIPGSDIHMYVYSPSLMYESRFVELRGGAQFYDVDINATQKDDARLSGVNYRATARVRVIPNHEIYVLGGYAYRTNQQIDVLDLTRRLDDDYTATTWNAGAEINLGDFGFGGGYYQIKQDFGPTSTTDLAYVNVAGSYWLMPGILAAGVRYAQILLDLNSDTTTATESQSFHGSLRLFL